MRIRKPKDISTAQLLIVTAIGFCGGVYIWQPLLLKLKKENESNLNSTENSPAAAVTVAESTKCEYIIN